MGCVPARRMPRTVITYFMATLHHEIVEAPGSAPTRQMLLLHGIYGAGRNWGTIARRLVRARPDWRVVLVDLRSHGQSPRLAPHTIDCCAADLLDLEDHLGSPADAVLGHSFGGKVALVYGRQRAGGSRAAAKKKSWNVTSGSSRPLAPPAPTWGCSARSGAS